MFNYEINWNKIIQENLPIFLQTIFRIKWILALIKPFKMIYSEFNSVMLEYIYKVRFTGQICYLETILNERFDPTGNGIYITNGNSNQQRYLYYRSESKPPDYIYFRHSLSQAYLTDDYAIDGAFVYKALSNNTGKKPSLYPAYWQYYKEVEFIYYRSEFSIQYDFIVNVPITILFDNKAMRALIDFYRLAGKRYKIITY